MCSRSPRFIIGLLAVLCILTIFIPSTPAADSKPGKSDQVSVRQFGISLAARGADGKALTTAGMQFPETAASLQLVVKSGASQLHAIYSYWHAEKAEDIKPGQRLYSRSGILEAGKELRLEVKAPPGGFAPGRYRIEIKLGERRRKVLRFTITQVFDSAILAKRFTHKPAYNIAFSEFGGKVRKYTSQYDAIRWAAKNLVDGKSYRVGWQARLDCTSCGWSAVSRNRFPQDLDFSFYRNRAALIDTVVLDTRTWETMKQRKGIPRHVEIWAREKRNEKFRRVRQVRLHNVAAEQFIRLPKVRASEVRVRILSAFSRDYVQLGEVRIIEADSRRDSILKDYSFNLAHPAFGGHLVLFTSQQKQNPARELFDNRVTNQTGWVSAASAHGSAAYLPQEFILGFERQRSALIDRIEFNLLSGKRASGKEAADRRKARRAWVKKVIVYGSNTHPFEGYVEVGVFRLKQSARKQLFRIGRRFRYLKIRLVDNYGADYTSLGEIRVIEGRAEDYHSILADFFRGRAETQDEKMVTRPVDDPGNQGIPKKFRQEKEPNNARIQVSQTVGVIPVRGRLDPLNEFDLYRIRVNGKERQALTLDIRSRPFLNSSITLMNEDEDVIKRYDPGSRSQNHARFTWFVDPGKYYLKLKSEPASLVLMWDTSGSMEGRTGHLLDAVNAFVSRIRHDEKVNLLRFSNGQAEVLLPRFTSDRKKLKQAIKNRVFARGGTPLYDAMEKAISLLKDRKGNRAIVLLSDGADSESRANQQKIIYLLRKHKIRVFTVGLGADLGSTLPEYVSTGRNLLRYISLAANGQAWFTPKSENLKQLFERIAQAIRQPPEYFLSARVNSGRGQLQLRATGERIPAVSAPARIQLILDASGSMRRRIGRHRMIDIARKVLINVVHSLPPDLQLALRVYGRRIREGKPGACRDTELLVAFRKGNHRKMVSRIRKVRALGTTPLAWSLKQVYRDFHPRRKKRRRKDRKSLDQHKLVVLVTDGREECGGKPLAAVRKLRRSDSRIRVNVIGFALSTRVERQQMRALATAGGGRYFDARNARALARSIRKSMAVSYDIHDESGIIVATGEVDHKPVSLPDGVYNLVIHTRDREFIVHNVTVVRGKSTRVELKKEGREIGVRRVKPE